ncbi:hypothetical protein [Sedimentitalea todarodis]|uniref:Uncharacterized protein n=1 Tax=Sedimentitalea todarodis TaxID=1631240 RepID=A0ABU3VAE0_9RHOB|nr:hypothetical protein [Sedimentitalea todarodis]MDU9003146.1 hypothetical protein [Sedimentitalea todarodis]
MAKDGDLVLPAPETEAGFAPLVVFDVEPARPVEFMAGSVAVRLDGAKPADRIAKSARARRWRMIFPSIPLAHRRMEHSPRGRVRILVATQSVEFRKGHDEGGKA